MHPLLQRQIRRYFSTDEVPEEMARLFAAIDQTYQQADQDRQLIEQSLELSSQELNERYDVLEQQLQINRAAKNDLERTLSLLDTTFDATEEGILVVANDGGVVKFNKIFVDLWNIPHSVLDTGDDAELLASALSQVADPEAFRRRVEELYDDPHSESVDMIELIDGRVLERFTRPQVMQGETVGRVWSFRDITARKAAEQRLELSRRVFDVSTQGIMVTDGQLRVMDANRALCDLLKLDISEVLGHSLPELSNTQQCSSFNSNFVTKLTAEGEWWGELKTSVAEDDHRVVWINFSAVHSDQGDLTHYVGIFSDITKLKEVEEKLQQLAYFDPLTGLPNRRLFKEKVEKTIASEERIDQKHALLFLDLDRFKFVNDSLGHLSGDELLVRVAERLGREIRRGDLASRQGGDEFAVALFDLQDDAMIGDIAKRIIESMTRPFRIKNQDLYIGASVGVCVMPQQATTFDDAMRKADMAMYLAKASGKGRYCFWDQETQAQMDQRILVESELREAIRLNQLHMFYQPIVDCVSGKPVSMEALLRWEHVQRGPIPPDQFVRIAEEVGLITELEDWVINDVCRQVSEWLEDDVPLVPVSVNISAQHLADQNLRRRFVNAMQRYGVESRWLSIEVTESTAMREPQETIEVLRELQLLGLQSAIDDFGTGYSSLSYLKQLPANTLKIDRSFVKDIVTDSNDRDISNAIIDLGHSLSMRTIAEGVETEEQLALLREMGCDLIQGWLFAKAISADDVARYLLDQAGSGKARSHIGIVSS